MAGKLFAILAVTLPAVGCMAGDLQRRYDMLALDNEQLQRDKARLEADLLACRARCEALERGQVSEPPPKAGVTTIPFEVPSELQGKVDIHKRGRDTVIDIPSDVFFASGSATLNRSGQSTMGDVVRYIRTNHPNGTLRIEGHSDTDPIRRTRGRFHCNWDLSFERSHAVMHHLVERGGFDPRRVVCEAWGEFHPKDARNKSRNRRVEIVIAE